MIFNRSFYFWTERDQNFIYLVKLSIKGDCKYYSGHLILIEISLFWKMNSKLSLAAFCILLASVQGQMRYGGGYYGQTNHGIYGTYGIYGPYGLQGSQLSNVNPSIGHIADSFFQRITRRLFYISAEQRPQAETILKEAAANFQQCMDDFATQLSPSMHEYKRCLAIRTQNAMDQIRYLEVVNRPYGYGFGGYGPQGVVGVQGPAERSGNAIVSPAPYNLNSDEVKDTFN